MPLCLNTQHYKIWIKGKVEQSKKRCRALLSLSLSIYIYIYILARLKFRVFLSVLHIYYINLIHFHVINKNRIRFQILSFNIGTAFPTWNIGTVVKFPYRLKYIKQLCIIWFWQKQKLPFQNVSAKASTRARCETRSIFYAEYSLFNFRVFLLLDWLLKQG